MGFVIAVRDRMFLEMQDLPKSKLFAQIYSILPKKLSLEIVFES